MTGTQPPLNMKNKDGELIGLDVELARALADAMDLELELVETPFAELLFDLEANKIDLVISSLTITPARNARVAFAGPYLISGSSLLTREDLIADLGTISGLNSAERTWAALEGSTGEDLILDVFPLANLELIEDQEAAVIRIGDGELDGLIADLPFVSYQIARNPDLGLATLPGPFTTEPLGIALPPNSPLFANLVQNYLNTLDYTGRLIQMKARWLNTGDWMSEMPEH
jgi:ABC-type amino acid transport substrate-binding protein